MLALLDLSQVSPLQGALSIVFGIVIGTLLGIVGGGGSILTVPILVYVIGLSAQSATATSLAIVGASALAGAVPHARAGRVNPRVAILFGLVGIAGAFAGSWLNHQVSGPWILLLFGLLMLGVAVRMWRRRRPAAETNETEARIGWRAPAAGLVVGLLTGFFGVGGGFLIVPALTVLLGLTMRRAVATSLAIITMTGLAALASHLAIGSAPDWPVTDRKSVV